MNQMTIFLIFSLIVFLLPSCDTNKSDLNGCWILIPLSNEPSFNPLWSNQDSTILKFNKGILEVPNGVKTPDRYYGNHLPYHFEFGKLQIYSPIEKRWLNFRIKKDKRNYRLFNEGGIVYSLIKTQPFNTFPYPEIAELEFVISEDSLGLNEGPKLVKYLFDCERNSVDICTFFYYQPENNFSLNSRLAQTDKEYFGVQVSRLDKSMERQYTQQISDTPHRSLKITFSDNTYLLFDIGDNFNIPVNLKNFISYLSNYQNYIPFNTSQKCKIKK